MENKFVCLKLLKVISNLKPHGWFDKKNLQVCTLVLLSYVDSKSVLFVVSDTD